MLSKPVSGAEHIMAGELMLTRVSQEEGGRERRRGRRRRVLLRERYRGYHARTRLSAASGASPYRPKTAFRRVMVSRVDLDT